MYTHKVVKTYLLQHVIVVVWGALALMVCEITWCNLKFSCPWGAYIVHPVEVLLSVLFGLPTIKCVLCMNDVTHNFKILLSEETSPGLVLLA